MNNIEIIRGDTCQKNVAIIGIDNSLIENVYLTSKDLEIDKELTYDVNIDRWIFRMEAEETATLKRIRTDFDITVKFVGNDISTILYRGEIIIYPKVNKVGELSNE